MSTSQVTLHFADGEQALVHCDTESNIFNAAKAGGIGLAHDCLNGSCGTCKGHLRSGAVDYAMERSLLAVSGDEPDAVLVCQAQPVSASLDIELPYTRASLLPQKKRMLKIISKTKVSATVWDVRCKVEKLRMFEFLPGQYVKVSPQGQDFMRAYSPYTLPGKNEVGFLIRELANGAMSGYLNESPVVGDVWNVEGPFGVFYRRHTIAPSLYIAGGTGLAPILSMLSDQERLQQPTGPKHLVFGVSRLEDLFYTDELNALHAKIADLTVTLAVVDGIQGPNCVKGSVLDALSPALFQSLGTTGATYLCGPPAMVGAIRDRAQEWDVPLQRFYTEEFLPT